MDFISRAIIFILPFWKLLLSFWLLDRGRRRNGPGGRLGPDLHFELTAVWSRAGAGAADFFMDLTISFAGWDWVSSLDPSWKLTISRELIIAFLTLEKCFQAIVV